MSNLVVRNNLWIDINGAAWGGAGTLFQIVNGFPGAVIDHNTGLQSGSILTFGGEQAPDLVFTNNLAPHNEYGIIGSGSGVGTPSLRRYAATYRVERNAIVGLPAGVSGDWYPPGNLVPAGLDAMRFANAAGGDYRLLPASPGHGAGLDRKDIGVDMDALRAAIKMPF
jgi:hypothetical protein